MKTRDAGDAGAAQGATGALAAGFDFEFAAQGENSALAAVLVPGTFALEIGAGPGGAAVDFVVPSTFCLCADGGRAFDCAVVLLGVNGDDMDTDFGGRDCVGVFAPFCRRCRFAGVFEIGLGG